MATFLPVSINDDDFIRGAARLMWAGTTIAFPTNISSVINTSTYVAQSGWNDLGATKTGITITVNNTEEVFDVDQVFGIIDSRPTGWECTVGTSLAEMNLTHLQFAWEGSAITAVAGDLPGENQMGVGNPTIYTRRQLAVLFQKENGNLRAYCFRKAQRMPQASAILYSKTGEQQVIPMLFQCLADTSITDIYQRFFMIFDQTNQATP